MGSFNVHCVESGLALQRETRLQPLIEGTSGTFEPCAGPIVGMYDYYGGVAVRPAEARPDELRTVSALGNLCDPPKLIGRDGRDVWRAMSSDERRPMRWKGRIVAYALFDEAIARAIEKSADVVPPYAAASEDLFGHRILPRHRRWLAALRQWGTPLTPITVSLERAKQYGGVDIERESRSVQPLLDAARAKYRGQPAMLLAVAVNERGWREMDEGAAPRRH